MNHPECQPGDPGEVEERELLAAMARLGQPAPCREIALSTGLPVPIVDGRLRRLAAAGQVQECEHRCFVITATGRARIDDSNRNR